MTDERRPDLSATKADVVTGVRPDWRARMPEWMDCGRDQQEAYLRNLVSEQRRHRFAGVMHISDFRPTYEVPGRRKDGTIAGNRRLARATMVVIRFLRNVLLSVLGIVVGLMFENPTVAPFRRYHRVRGHEGCQALAFIAPIAPTPWTLKIDPVWLIWSPRQAVLFKLADDTDPTELTLLWEGRTADTVPRVDLYDRALVWRDGSTVVLHSHLAVSTSFGTRPSRPRGGQQ